MIKFSTCFIALILTSIVSGAPAPALVGSFVGRADAVAATSNSTNSTNAYVTVDNPDHHSPTHTSTAPGDPVSTVPHIDLDPNPPLWSESDPNAHPEGIRGGLGAKLLGPHNIPIELQNPDFLAPPTSDHGSLANAKWPFAMSHNRLQTGGWARQQNADVMPIATQMASVNMRLEANAVRELHWHKTAEWAYVLKGKTQITSVDSEGRNYIATVGPGDVWYFPPGTPHSLQGTDDDPEGSEFILVFDDGHFSEDSTFLLTDWLAHIPAEVIAKNFQRNITEFSHIPAEELYIFPAEPNGADSDGVQSPQGAVPDPFSFKFSEVSETTVPGGKVKVVDSTTFKISKTIAAAEVTVEPGHMRELHWHPTQDEWSFFLEGNARVTVFAAQSNARTFDYQAGDIGYVPATMGHYVENIGNTTLKFLEISKTDRFQDISLNQWLALTPPELVRSHLGFDDDTLAALSKKKNIII